MGTSLDLNYLESQRTSRQIRYTDEILGTKKSLAGNRTGCYVYNGIELNDSLSHSHASGKRESDGSSVMIRMFFAGHSLYLMKYLSPSCSSQEGLSVPPEVVFPLGSDNGSLTRIPPQLRHVFDVILMSFP